MTLTIIDTKNQGITPYYLVDFTIMPRVMISRSKNNGIIEVKYYTPKPREEETEEVMDLR